MKNQIIILSFIFIVFACDFNDTESQIIPSTSIGGGDDEEPIIQGGIVFPDGTTSSDTLVSIINSNSGMELDYTLSDESGKFLLKTHDVDSVIFKVVFPDGTFRTSKAIKVDNGLPDNIVVQ